MSHDSTDFKNGFQASIPVIIAIAPFGVLFGALAVDNGLSLFEASLMSLAVFAGASQIVGIDLFGEQVAPWLIVLSIFAVNFRHVLYSAVMGRRFADVAWPRRLLAFFFLTDPQFAVCEKRIEEGNKLTLPWYFGLAIPTYSLWVLTSILGALFGTLIPDMEALGIDFLVAVYFLGLLMSFRGRTSWLSVVAVSSLVALISYKTIGSPWHVSIGALAGILTAVIIGGKPEQAHPEEVV